MREMKDSGIQWIGKIPYNWEITRGGYLYTIDTGKKDAIAEDPEGDFAFFTCSKEQKRTKEFTFDTEALLVAGNGLVGYTTYYKGKFDAYQRTYVLHEFKMINPQFLKFYVSNNLIIEVTPKSQGSVIQFIKYDDLRCFNVCVPTQEEQKKIVSFLSIKCGKIDAIMADVQSQIETLEEYKKSVISETVTKGLNHNTELKCTGFQYWNKIPINWKLVDIKYLFKIVKRIAGKEGYDILSVTQKGLKVKDISNNEGQIADSYAGYQFVYPTDFVMNHMDLLTGWVDCSTMFGVTSPDYRVFRLRNKNNNLSYYKYVLQSCYFNKTFYSLGNGVSTLGRWRLQTESFNNFLFPLPQIEEQKQIADYLDRKCAYIDSVISDKKAQLETLEEYKKSLIYEYVTGKKEVPNE